MARNSLILSSALVGSLALLPQLAFAQSDQPNESVGLGEIVVTAQKREQNL